MTLVIRALPTVQVIASEDSATVILLISAASILPFGFFSAGFGCAWSSLERASANAKHTPARRGRGDESAL
jgi:hypothetical protein